MAQIISFERRANARPRPAKVEGGGQILFFMGVRYERAEGGAQNWPGEPKGGGGKKKRRARA
ncbi:MAG TPA: hypothetical protein VK446_11925 [Methylocystis sp.]|nr:hypothetical protein [Methylocystis sp.]